MLSRLKGAAKRVAEGFARTLAKTGASPTQLTLVGFFLNLAVGAVLAGGYLPVGGLLLLFASAFDTVDGALARVTSRATTFGAFLDSTLDRYSEAALLLGILYDASRRGDVAVSTATFIVIVGSLMVSYCRARAEGLGLSCEVGIAPRPERLVILGLGLFVGLELPTLLLLAIVTNVTAVQRILHVYALTTSSVEPNRPRTLDESPP